MAMKPMLLTKVPSLGEVLPDELVLLDLEAGLLHALPHAAIVRARMPASASPSPTSNCMAFSPRTVTEQEIFSLRRMEKERTV